MVQEISINLQIDAELVRIKIPALVNTISKGQAYQIMGSMYPPGCIAPSPAGLETPADKNYMRKRIVQALAIIDYPVSLDIMLPNRVTLCSKRIIPKELP